MPVSMSVAAVLVRGVSRLTGRAGIV